MELAEARRWLESPDAEEIGFDAALSGLVAASQTAIERAKHEKEEARQRELEQAQALAEARARVVRRTRRFAIGLAVVALIALDESRSTSTAGWRPPRRRELCGAAHQPGRLSACSC